MIVAKIEVLTSIKRKPHLAGHAHQVKKMDNVDDQTKVILESYPALDRSSTLGKCYLYQVQSRPGLHVARVVPHEACFNAVALPPSPSGLVTFLEESCKSAGCGSGRKCGRLHGSPKNHRGVTIVTTSQLLSFGGLLDYTSPSLGIGLFCCVMATSRTVPDSLLRVNLDK